MNMIEIKKILSILQPINAQIVIDEGLELGVVNPAKNIIALSKFKSPFDFCIYDISNFLATLNLCDEEDGQLEVDDGVATISDKVLKVKYSSSNRSLIQPMNRDYKILKKEFYNKVEISSELLKRVLVTATTVDSKNIVFEFKAGSNELHIKAQLKHKASNSFDITVPLDYIAEEDAKYVLPRSDCKVYLKSDYVLSFNDDAIKFESDLMLYIITTAEEE